MSSVVLEPLSHAMDIVYASIILCNVRGVSQTETLSGTKFRSSRAKVIFNSVTDVRVVAYFAYAALPNTGFGVEW